MTERSLSLVVQDRALIIYDNEGFLVENVRFILSLLGVVTGNLYIARRVNINIRKRKQNEKER